jgi:hypothetical protein
LWEGRGEIPLPDPISDTYVLGTFLLFKGEKGKTRQVFQHILQLQQWGAFGWIAAEIELTRSK